MLKDKGAVQYYPYDVGHAFPPTHPDPHCLEKEQPFPLLPSKKAVVYSQSLREPWFRGAWSYTEGPEHCLEGILLV